MSYAIVYHSNKTTRIGNHNRKILAWVVSILSVAAIMFLCLYIPDSLVAFRRLLHPLTDEQTVEAFQEMLVSIGNGTDLEAAVTVFCRQVIDNAA